MARKNTPAEEEIIDLTDLIEQGGGAGNRAAAAYAKAARPPDEDFEVILSQTGATPPERPVDADETLDMPGMGDIDNLMDSLDIPPQPGKGASRQASDDDLDSVLDDLLGHEPERPAPKAAEQAPPQTAPKKPGPASENGALESDLDDLMASFDTPAPEKQASGANAALDADVDDILADLEPPRPTPKPAAPQPDIADDLDELLNETKARPAQKPAASQPDIADDLDDLLSETEARPAQKPAAPQPDIADDLDDLLSETEARPAQKRAAPQPDIADDLDDLLSETEARPAQKPAAPQPDIADDLDDLLSETEASQALKTADAEAAGNEEPGDLAPASSTADARNDNAGIAESLEDFMGNRDQATPRLTEAPVPTRAELPVAKQSPETSATWPPELIAGLCRNMAHGSQETLQKFSHELGAQSAHVEDLGEEVVRIGKRLLACESLLSAARVRIGNLEKNLESANALEDLIRDGTPLQTGFMALISNAVANALKGYAPQESDAGIKEALNLLTTRSGDMDNRLAALEERIEALEGAARLGESVEKLSGRLAELEERVDELSSRFETELDKAVSATVAKVLQEEITRLMQG